MDLKRKQFCTKIKWEIIKMEPHTALTAKTVNYAQRKLKKNIIRNLNKL